MSLKEDICEALRVNVLPPQLGAVKVTSWDEDIHVNTGGCDTCGPDITYEVWISYVVADGSHHSWFYDGRFTELLERIT